MAKGKKNPSDKEYDSERETRVLLEKIHSEVKTVAEGHSGIIRKLDEHDERFDKIESEVGSLRTGVGSVKSELQYVKAAVMDTNQTVKSIEKKLDNHETRISKIEEKVHT